MLRVQQILRTLKTTSKPFSQLQQFHTQLPKKPPFIADATGIFTASAKSAYGKEIPSQTPKENTDSNPPQPTEDTVGHGSNNPTQSPRFVSNGC